MSQSSSESLIAHITAKQDDLAALQDACNAAAEHERGAVVAALETICRSGKGNVAVRSAQFNYLIHHKELLERQRANPSPYNGVSLDDTRFQAVRPEIAQWQSLTKEWLALKPDSYSGLYMRALSLLADHPAQAVEPLFAKLRAFKRADLPSITHFDGAFHRSLEALAEDAVAFMPECSSVRDAGAHERFMFSACDYAYFEKYGMQMMASLRRHDANGGFHLHLFDTTDAEAKAVAARLCDMGLEGVSLSREWTGLRTETGTRGTASEAARAYYHVARFYRFWQFLRARPGVAGWQLDADSLFNGGIDGLFERLDSHDMSIWLLPGRAEPHNKFAAGLLGIAPTAPGRRYLQRVAGYVADCVKANVIPWGTDQTILYAVYVGMADEAIAPSLGPVTASIFDGQCNEGAAIWPGKCDIQSPNYSNFKQLLLSLRAA
ncbi:MAG: hypothetical protein AB7I36_18355 [Rhodospirillaceae bacterium]